MLPYTLRFSLSAALGCLFLCSATPAQAPLKTELVVSGLSSPTWVGAPPGDTRLFVCEQSSGLVRIVSGGAILPTPFLDLSGQITSGGERGLLALAFHPGFATNGRVFVTYSDLAGDTVLAGYQVSATDPDVVDPATKQVLLTIPQPWINHKAGCIAFGPLDGYLYMSTGDGAALDPVCTGQSTGNLLGKFLRLDVDGGSPYAIPPTNPYAAGGAFPPETWSIGWRNPWRFGFDELTGELLIADVGEATIEEIDHEPPLTGGRNYGWVIHEGTYCDPAGPSKCPMGTAPPCNDPAYTQPIHEYTHADGCAVVGGPVYRGSAIPQLAGTYFFADYCSARIWSFVPAGGGVSGFQERTTELAPGGGISIQFISTFGVDGAGEILIADWVGGEIFRVIPAVPPGGDCDGDGQPDDVQIAANPVLDLDISGILDICEGLAGDTGQLSVASGGVLQMSLEAPAQQAGRPYLVLGSASGTTPPVPVDGQLLPLVAADGYFLYTLTNANGPVLINTLGLLDGAGKAAAGFVMPPLNPGMAGNTLHHAYAVFLLPGDGSVEYTSHALPLQLVP